MEAAVHLMHASVGGHAARGQSQQQGMIMPQQQAEMVTFMSERESLSCFTSEPLLC